MKRGGAVYILTNKNNTTLYVGVSSNLIKRVHEHIHKVHNQCFTAKYNLNKLVYYEAYSRIEDALHREKQLKAGNRKRKVDLIETINPDWNDLYPELQ